MKNDYQYIFDIDEQSKQFLFTILSYYRGTAEEKLERASEFLDDLIFKTRNDLRNPFSNNSRVYYKLAEYSRSILIPEMKIALKKLDESDPFNIHEWN